MVSSLHRNVSKANLSNIDSLEIEINERFERSNKMSLKEGSKLVVDMLEREAANTNLSTISLNSSTSQSSDNNMITLKDLAQKDPKKALSQLSQKYAAKKREIQQLQGSLSDVLKLIQQVNF